MEAVEALAKQDKGENLYMAKKELITAEEEIKEEDQVIEDEKVHKDMEEEASFDGQDRIFEGGPTYDQLQQWKSLYSNEVFVTEFGEDVIIFRPIRRREYRDIYEVEGDPSNYYIEEQVCRKSILWPENYADQKMTFGKAGIPSTLSQMIMERSGFLRPAVHQL